MDILQWRHQDYPPGTFRVIAASVPCAEYSMAKTTAPRDFSKADALVCKVMDIIDHFRPKFWWVENPRTGHLKNRPMMRNLPFVDIDYCQFSDWGYQKPTRFWGSSNLGALPHVKCPGQSCKNIVQGETGFHHRERLGGNDMHFSTTQKGRIPPLVVDYLLREGEYAPCNFPKSRFHGREKGYKVDPKIRRKMFLKLGVERAFVHIDLFASEKDAQEKLFLTEHNSAWRYNWSKLCLDKGVLWANPLFEDIKKVLTKACLEPCCMVLVTPLWKTAQWAELLGKTAIKEFVVPPFRPLYERSDGKGLLAGRHWGSKATLIDTRVDTPSEEFLDPLLVREIKSETLDWGLEELRKEMQLYPRGGVLSKKKRKSNDDSDDEHEVNIVHEVGNNPRESKMLMDVYARLPSGRGQMLRILVDTGAEVNLVREGLLPHSEFSRAESRLHFTMANGQPMRGGTHSVQTQLIFSRHVGHIGVGEFGISAELFEADIHVDAILGHPWLYRGKIAIHPHLHALSVERDEYHLDLLYSTHPGKTRRKPRRRKPRVNCVVRPITASSDFSEDFSDEEDDGWLEHLGLEIPHLDDNARSWSLSKEERQIVKRRILARDVSGVRTVIIAKGDSAVENPQVQSYRDKIHAEYDGLVLCKEVIPNPPVRGRYGEAFIPLKSDAIPQRQKTFRQFGEKNEALKKITQEWIDRGFIEKPTDRQNEWCSQAFAVPKKSATFPWRGVVDMRGPNSQTRACGYPLPSIEETLVSQGKNFIFSVLDLRQAFHQMPLAPESRHITCTFTPLGLYQWKVNVMGLKNASIQFQKMMDDVLEPVRDVADCYIDDIIVGTRVDDGEILFAQHDKDLRRVLEVLKARHLVADITKCRLFVPEVEFCGHILGRGVRRPAPGKLLAIEKWEVPKTITELRSFLGFANYYSSYIKEFAKVTAILQEKLKVPKDVGKKGSRVKITWTPEDQEAFDEVKRRLCSGLELQRVDPDRPFVLRVDASQFAVGATLEQGIDKSRKPTIEDVRSKKTVPVAFMSRKLTPGQTKWVAREQETYAIILALLKWERWIGLQPVTVLTDHKALQEWLHEALGVPSGPLGRRLRWHLEFSKFDLEVGYIPGKENMICDILSRWAYPASKAFRDLSKHGSKQDVEDVRKILAEEARDLQSRRSFKRAKRSSTPGGSVARG
jgi:hypothetical protein